MAGSYSQNPAPQSEIESRRSGIGVGGVRVGGRALRVRIRHLNLKQSLQGQGKGVGGFRS